MPFALYQFCSKVFITIALFVFIGALSASAASLSFVPATKTFEVGDTFTVNVQVRSDGIPINAVSGVISFDPQLLEVVSLSKNGSILSLWVQEPVHNNTQGSIALEGIILNPGFSGTGKVIGVTFRAKTTGETSLSFNVASVLANDGTGSEALSARGTASFTLVPALPSADLPGALDTVGESTQQGEAPGVSISGDDDFFINSSTARFLFTYDEATVKSLRLLFDSEPVSTPTVTYTPAITYKDITDIPEGTSYIHAQTQTADGWGAVAHVKVVRDTTAPTLLVRQVHTEGSDVGIFSIVAHDEHSRVTSLQVSVDGESFLEVSTSTFATFVTDTLTVGGHVLEVKAYDAADNQTTNRQSFTLNTLQEKTEHTEGTFWSNERLTYIAFLPLLFLFISLLVFCFYTVYLHRRYRSFVRKETQEALTTVRSAFRIILEELSKDVDFLEKTKKKRSLTKEEKKLLKNLNLNLEGARAVIEKEVTDLTRP
jgi:hypothetical protein